MKPGKEHLSFKIFIEDTFVNAIKNLSTGKANVSNYIPVSIMKETFDAYCPKLPQIINDCLENNIFSDIRKNSEITPCFKKGNKSEKENYRPFSTLSSFSKVFEKTIYNQLNEFIETKFSKFLAGFRKNHNTQYALLRMVENWKTQINKRNKISVIIMDPLRYLTP